MAKNAKLETEFKLLKREHCKAEVRIKALQRDLLRMQAHISSNADSTSVFQAEKQFLVDRVTSLGYEKEEILAQLESLKRTLDERESETSDLKRVNVELAAKNASLSIELEGLKRSYTDAPKLPPLELVSVGVNTDLQVLSSLSRDQQKLNDRPKSVVANLPIRPPMGDQDVFSHDTLETNIMRLTRLADALLGRDE